MSDTGPNDPYGSTQPPPGWTPAQPGQPPGWGTPPPPGYGTPPGYGSTPPGYGAQGGYPGAPPGFGTPAGYYPAPTTDGKAIGALIAAIVSYVFCPFVPAVVALVLASQASRTIAESGGRVGGSGMVTAAKVLSWINIALSILGIALFAMFAVAASNVEDSTFEYNSTICNEGPYYSPPPEC